MLARMYLRKETKAFWRIEREKSNKELLCSQSQEMIRFKDTNHCLM